MTTNRTRILQALACATIAGAICAVAGARAAAERKAIEEREVAELKAREDAERKAIEEREVAELKAREDAERKAREEREVAERKAREEREVAERKAKEKKVKTLLSSPTVKAATEAILAEMVQIPGKDYKIGKTEVTQSQWEAIMGENPSRFKGDNNPVETVSWDDCQRFLSLLNLIPAVKDSGLVFRLPTSEEWEYACRADSWSSYCKLADGTQITRETLGQVAWFRYNAHQKTHPVGQKQPNAFGLYDMHGNVSEWTSTVYEPGSTRNGLGHVIRGGSWESEDWDCESYDRDRCEWLSTGYDRLGFRLCAEKTEKTEARVAAEREKAKKLLSSPVVKAAAEAILAEMVQIPGKNYKIGKTEVTQSQWEAIMGENPSRFKGDNNPVETVSWDDCQRFLSLLNSIPAVKDSGLTFCLPTEDEWKYACRAGARGDYCKLADGTEIMLETLGQVAWIRYNASGKTHPVAQKQPNAFGLYDMHGNVWEWTSTIDDECHVSRGGSYYDPPGGCERSLWSKGLWTDEDETSGFRLCAKKNEKTEAKAAAERKAREEREAAERKAKGESGQVSVEDILVSMIDIPGKDFKMGKTEVTQAQWEAVMGENPSEIKGADNPVEKVSWVDCQRFLYLLNSIPAVKDSGLAFRLPTAEEWEYACRAGATGDYSLLADGTEITRETLGIVAWFDDNSDRKTHPVGQKEPNAFGLYDMHGNVWEWTSTVDAVYCVYRGGSSYNSAGLCESSHRRRCPRYERGPILGFRLCAEKSDP